MPRLIPSSLALWCLCGAVGPLRAAEPSAPRPSPAAVEYFEAKVRPVLAEHCYGCHGPKKQNAGLRLDTSAGLKQGADSGPVLVAGDPVKSLLLKVVRRQGENPMPPDKPLPPAAVAALTEWVKAGAAYPDDGAVKPAAAAGRSHWAFQPVRDRRPPAVKDAARAAAPIDRFLLAELEAKGLTFSPPADRRTLLRRVSYDLVGLPPTAAEVAAFEADASPQAFAEVVDRLLASPHYGERWGRYWLDLARYADTKGYVFREDRNYPYAYTYRDYVVRSFNEDKPYDRFVVEQLAADKLDLGADVRPLAAMGFLTVGRRFLNDVHDVIDDRIDVITRGLMGLTVSCARCHDHKYDPIPTKDYYSLYGVLRSSVEPKELPLIGEAPRTPEAAAFRAEYAKRVAAVEDLVAKLHGKEVARLRTPEAVAAYLKAALETRGLPGTALKGAPAARDLSPVVVARWRTFLNVELKSKGSAFAPLAALAVQDKDFAAASAKLAAEARPGPVARALAAAKPKTSAEAYAAVAKLLAEPPKEAPALAEALAPNGPADVPLADFEKIWNRADRDAVTDARAKADKFLAASPFAPPRAMVLGDGPPFEPYVFLRGNQGQHGPTVPRQFPEVVSGAGRKPFRDGSGRLELARAIADPKNPLTARVWVNRVWGYHFGQGLVRSPSNFGTRAEPPTHPELLDWLAARFVESGWSTKALHRQIVLSTAYRQSSKPGASTAGARDPLPVDPENLLLGRQGRGRLDFEALRDSMLFVSGQLDPAVGGRSVDVFAAPFTARRTVYAYIDRQNVPGAFRAFDVAGPDQHSSRRYQTTVPQQALFLMNSPFVAERARALAARSAPTPSTPEERVRSLYLAAYGRAPRDEERSLAREFVASATATEATFGPWEQLAQVLLLSNEFAFAD